jgi:hypothetical protein
MHDIQEVIDLGIDYRSFNIKDAITLEQARPLVLGRKGPVVIESLRNWCKRGIRIDKALLFFPSVKLNNKHFTMREWVERFEEARREPSARPLAKRLEPASRTRTAQLKRVERYLQQQGFDIAPTPAETN